MWYIFSKIVISWRWPLLAETCTYFWLLNTIVTRNDDEISALGFCNRASWANFEVRGKTNKMQHLEVYYEQIFNMFRASLCPSSGDQDVCYCTWCAALLLVDVVASGCEALCCRVWALWRLMLNIKYLYIQLNIKCKRHIYVSSCSRQKSTFNHEQSYRAPHKNY